MSENELEEKFWQLLDKIVQPMVNLSYDYTSPSVERSVLLRMGFNSLQAREIVKGCEKRKLLGKGAGNVVLKLAEEKELDLETAGKALSRGKYWDEAVKIFGGEFFSEKYGGTGEVKSGKNLTES